MISRVLKLSGQRLVAGRDWKTLGTPGDFSRVSLSDKTDDEIRMVRVCNALPVSPAWEGGYSAQDG